MHGCVPPLLRHAGIAERGPIYGMLYRMAFDLHFQDPELGTPTLLEVLADAAQSSDGGIAVFSFASRDGVRLLFSDPDFSDFLHRGKFRLVVGVDAVTTPDVLALLAEETQSRSALRAQVFLHDRRAALFHPKISWFYSARTGRSVVGSGNLTRGGLLNNWEAFVDGTVKAKGVKRINSLWQRWLKANKGHLRCPTDPEAISRARANLHARKEHEEEAVEIEDDRAETTHSSESVLVAEIPRAASRWNQANFDKSTYTGFFGMKPGTPRRVVLYPILPDGTVGDPEVRPGVSVKSQNFRIELGQAMGLRYPSEGRPVGIFRRTGVRRFRYRLLMPSDNGYDGVASILERQAAEQDGRIRMKRIVLPYAEFRQLAGATL